LGSGRRPSAAKARNLGLKILVRATNWIGDAVMSIPALEAIRCREPQARISIVARRGVAALYQNQNFVDEILALEDSENPVAELRALRFDVAILLQNAFNAAWMAWRAGIPKRIGYARDGRSLLLTQSISLPKQGEIPAHESYYYLELLRRAGWLNQLPTVESIRLKVDAQSLERARKVQKQSGARPSALCIALAPGAAFGSAKCWPPERFAELADRLVRRFDADVIIFGAKSERQVAARIISRMQTKAIDLLGLTPAEDLAGHFAACDVFVGNDSGAMHVAAAIGLPVVAIFGSTDPNGTAPVTTRKTIVRKPPSCSPCFLRECPIDHRCMTKIEVSEVEEEVRRWVDLVQRG
jgi:heptosyltransferase II